MNDLQELRRSSVISTHGPGSVIDFRSGGGAVSGIAAGLEEWDSSFPPAGLAHPQVIREPRLQKKLGVSGFRTPPVIPERSWGNHQDNRRLVAVRFPTWLQCPKCDIIKPERRWSGEPGKAYRYCPRCTRETPGREKIFVIPVRFVLACSKGHIDEFPWDWWVKHRADCPILQRGREGSDRHPGLKLRAEKAGLAGLILSCPKCKARRSMDGVFSGVTWSKGPKCRGRRPWLAQANESCGCDQRAVQRGASNLYFPVVESALSIPPWSDGIQEALGHWWAILQNLDPPDRLSDFIAVHAEGELGSVLRDLDMSPAQLAETVLARLDAYESVETADLRTAEYRQLVYEPGERRSLDAEFETRPVRVPANLDSWISHVVRAVRLREVRALRGFTRINPPGDPDSPEIASLSKSPLEWLPAIEVRGEGIFMTLDEDRLRKWESRPDVRERVAWCQEKRMVDWRERYDDQEHPPPPLTPRYMLCHTLSHALMRQLTLECGYSSASLQERIYASEEESMAGLLIYTATPDSDGTLGGLERQGRSSRIGDILQRAVEAIEWCSSDPLCITNSMNAINSYSNSVCHACCLVPETSCETFNTMLDRALVTGDGTGSGLGFFEAFLRAS